MNQSIQSDQVSASSLSESLIENNVVQKPKESRCSKIFKVLCCIFDSEEEITAAFDTKKSNRRRLNRVQILKGQPLSKEERKEKQDLLLMGNTADGSYCLVRLTQKNFFVDVQQRRSQVTGSQQRNESSNYEHIIFSLFSQGIKIESQEFIFLLPEKLSRYLAKRIMQVSPQVVLDGNSWCSGPYLFLGEVPVLIASAQLVQTLTAARHNSQVYGVRHNIDFILSDILILKTKPDVLYLHFGWVEGNEPFSVYTHMRPDIKKVLPKALQMSQNIVLVLPKFAQLNEISTLIAFYQRKLNFQNNKIEIQKVLVDGYLQFIIVYIGEIAMIQNQDEFEFITKLLLSDSNQEQLYSPTYTFLNRLGEKQPIHQLIDLILYFQQQNSTKSETILSSFINYCIQYNLSNKEEVDDIFSEQSNEILLQDQTPHYTMFQQTPATFDPKDQLTSSPKFEESPKPFGIRKYTNQSPKNQSNAEISFHKNHDVSFQFQQKLFDIQNGSITKDSEQLINMLEKSQAERNSQLQSQEFKL